jgi:hypothetical protein
MQPASGGVFVGRAVEMAFIRERALQPAREQKRPRFVFVEGGRGLGKRSLARHVAHVVAPQEGMAGVVLDAADAHDPMTLAGSLLVRAAQLARREPAGRIAAWLKTILPAQVETELKVGTVAGPSFGLKTQWRPQDVLRELNGHATRFGTAEGFAELLQSLVAQLECAGLCLVIDEIDALTRGDGFAPFLKSLAESQAATGGALPVTLILCGLSEHRERLHRQHPSIDRVIDPVILHPLSDAESRDVLCAGFDEVFYQYSPTVFDPALAAAAGQPFVLHLLGEEIFAVDSDRAISPDDVQAGLVAAARRYWDRITAREVYGTLKSDNYLALLDLLGAQGLRFARFERAGLAAVVPEAQRKSLDNFIRKLRELDLVEPVPGDAGRYRFRNPILLQSIQYGRAP